MTDGENDDVVVGEEFDDDNSYDDLFFEPLEAVEMWAQEMDVEMVRDLADYSIDTSFSYGEHDYAVRFTHDPITDILYLKIAVEIDSEPKNLIVLFKELNQINDSLELGCFTYTTKLGVLQWKAQLVLHSMTGVTTGQVGFLVSSGCDNCYNSLEKIKLAVAGSQMSQKDLTLLEMTVAGRA